MKLTARQANFVAWTIVVVAVVLAIVAWGQGLRWHVLNSSALTLFPVFGLLAFSLLWSQYVVLALRRYFRVESGMLTKFFEVNSWLVLVAILLHPGLLIWQLWRDGAGPPPGSELHYVGPGLKAFVILGFINLIILLLFETRRWFADKSWWRPFTYLVDLAMFSIFYHGLKLGTQLQTGWYRIVWFFYGVTLLVALGCIYYGRWKKHSAAAQ